MIARVVISEMWLLGRVFCLLLASLVDGAQHFTEVPRDTNVIRGQTAVLKCVIGDRKGAVQWTKDGFSLGFNRTIPGYDRYSITSSHEHEFNLMIVNAHLEDDAMYECQVLPFGGDDRLQARAVLTVLVPCEPPVIRGYTNGSTLEVPYTQQTLVLVCEARNGRPPATIEWYRNGVKVTSNIQYSTEPNPDDKRETASSALTVSLANHVEENGVIYRCQAKNSAVFGSPLTTSVTLSILFPPGPPVISGYNGGVVNINNTLVLTCSSTGGNPLATVTWYRNNEPVDWSFTTSNGRSINEYTFRVSSSDNNAVYRCQVTNLVATTPLTAEYTLQVHFPPKSVRISGAPDPVQADTAVTLTCVTSNSNPKATITWFSKGRQLAQNEATETYTPSPNGGFVTRSQVQKTFTHRDHNSIFECRANNSQFGQIVTDNLTLSVLYPPNQPDISGQRESLRAGDLERMTCLSVGGNPLAELKWYKGDTLIRDSVYRTTGHMAQAEIAVVIKPDDNGATYQCKASNRATPTPLVASVRLTVHFPPSQVVITVSPSRPKAGQQIDLTCVSSSSNPPAEIIWIRNGRRTPGVDLGTVDAEWGGKNTTNRLRFTPTSRDHNAVYGCRATNRLLDQSVNDAVTLNVLFKPEFDVDTLPSKVDVKKGEGTSLNLTAHANPPEVTYQLYKDGNAFTLPARFKMVQGMLNISAARKEDRGAYMVKGTNIQGFSTFNFSINVKYPAEIIDVTNKIVMDETETAVFTCKFDANPITPDVVSWFREDFDMSRTRTRVEGNVSYLTVSDLTREDSGTFKCLADNRIGAPVTRTAQLVVRFAPVIDRSPEISRSAGEKGSTVSLKCLARGAPDVAITWTRNNNPVRSGSKFQITTDQLQLVVFESTLTVQQLEVEDYGAYVCTASNSKGSDSHSITLTGTSKPNPPYSIEFVNATSSSITISWKPGFDGGLVQSFRVRYKPVEARGYIYVDVRPFGATIFTVKGLELGTEYELTVLAFNDRGESAYQARGIVAKTSDVVTPADIATSELQGSDEIPVIIILVVCIVGVFILSLNVGLILFFIKRRKKRMEGRSYGASESASHNNTFELYGSTKGDGTIYPAHPDDSHSYGTYDKNMDDFSDDYIRDYDRECETHVFLPSQPEYPGSRPYSPPPKVESPIIGGGHKMTYITGDLPDRLSPWSEDNYKAIHPKHNKHMYENGVRNGNLYELQARNKVMNELSDLNSQHSGRTGKTPPPPPTRSTSRSGFSSDNLALPLSIQTYEPEEGLPYSHYDLTPASPPLLSPNIVASRGYSGPAVHASHRVPSPQSQLSSSSSSQHTAPSQHTNTSQHRVPTGAELRGHLV